ncbi:MAG: hypothetical protein AAF975_08240, partial [Spirochaetota bacterium]
MRDEINLFSRKEFLYSDNSNFTLTPLGNYFIVDRPSRKIFHYTNYGKLNYIIYNPDYRYDSDKGNPKYLDKSWRLGEISEIAASLERLYVTTTLTRSAKEEAAPARATGPNNFYHQVILVFNDRGEYLFQVGPEGVDSQPFLHPVTRLFVDKRENLFVISRQPEAYQIYQFSPQGSILRTFELSVRQTILQNRIFQNQGNAEKNQTFFEIVAPHFSQDGKDLFFELYRYTTKINESTSKNQEINV